MRRAAQTIAGKRWRKARAPIREDVFLAQPLERGTSNSGIGQYPMDAPKRVRGLVMARAQRSKAEIAQGDKR